MSYDLAVYKEGKGPRVILLHGLVSTHRFWTRLTHLLVSDHEVISLDLLGFGDSPRPKDNEYSVDDHVDAIYNTLKRAELLDKPYIIVGHSMGSPIAVRFAKRYPKHVRGLVLSAMPLMPKGKERRFLYREFPDLVPLMTGPHGRLLSRLHEHFESATMKVLPRVARRKGYDREIIEDVVRHSWESFNRSTHRVLFDYDPITDMADLRIPIQLITADRDWITVDAKKHLEILEFPGLTHVKVKGKHNIPLHNPEVIASAIASL